MKQKAFVGLAILFWSLSASAKDLTSRLGVGYTDQFSFDLPSLAVQYFPSAKLGLGANLGIDTIEDASAFGFQVRIYRVIFTEDNMNFYMGSSAGLVSRETTDSSGDTENESGFELTGFVGGEFFFSGLESLGFSFEAGIGVASISSEVRFRTIGDSPIRAGMIFYF